MDVKNLIAYSQGPYVRQLSSPEIKAVQAYSKDSSLINNALRSDDSTSFFYRDQIELIDSALDKFSVDMPLKLYRKLFFLNKSKERAILSDWKDKGYIYDLAYMSTSLSKCSYDAPYNILLEINCDHLKGAYIEPLAVYDEEEFLIKRNSMLQIESIGETYDKRLNCSVDVVKTFLR